MAVLSGGRLERFHCRLFLKIDNSSRKSLSGPRRAFLMRVWNILPIEHLFYFFLRMHGFGDMIFQREKNIWQKKIFAVFARFLAV